MMYPKLSFPPIIESILLVRFAEVLTDEQIDEFCQSNFVSSGYIAIDESGDDVSASKLLRDKGTSESEDEYDKAIRINLDSLSFHRLKYSNFDELYDEFATVLRVLCDTVKGISFEKLSLRYLNSIHLPNRRSEFKVDDYLNYKLELPFHTSNIFLQFSVVNEEDKEMTGLVVHTTQKDRKPSSDIDPGILLDIIVRKELPSSNNQIEEVGSTFFKMREFKNHIFFTVVRSSIVETYK